MILFRSIVYFGYMSLSVIAFSLPIALFRRFTSYDFASRASNAWGRSNLKMLKWVCNLEYRIEGWENLPDKACVVLSKHQSAWETIALRGLLPPHQAWVLKQELLNVPFFGWALKAVEPIAIDRTAGRQAVKQIVSQGVHALENERWVIVFPEGTRVAPGKRKKYGIGGSILAERSGRPVVPIAHNAGVFWRRRGIRKYPGTIDVVIGKPISTENKKASQITREVEAWIESQMERLPSSR